MHPSLMFLHLISFAGAVGAGFAQQWFMSTAQDEQSREIQRNYELLAFRIVSRIELPAILVSMITGLTMVFGEGLWIKAGWMHAKITLVVLLAVLSHLEMFNARRILRASLDTQPRPDTVLDSPRESPHRPTADNRKRIDETLIRLRTRHKSYGRMGGLLVLGILILVCFKPF